MDTKTKHTEHFGSLESFIDFISTTDYERQSSVTGSKNFTASRDFDHAIEIARCGQDLGKINANVNRLESITRETMNPVYDVTGALVDVGAYLSGVPECMLDFQMEETHKYIALNVSLSENCGTSSVVFENKAVAVACIVDRLESMNYRVQVNAVACFKYTALHTAVITVKRFDQKLSIAQLSGCLTTSFFRRLCFAWTEKTLHPTPVPSSYGYPRDAKTALGDRPGEINLPGASQFDLKTEYGTLEYVDHVINLINNPN